MAEPTMSEPIVTIWFEFISGSGGEQETVVTQGWFNVPREGEHVTIHGLGYTVKRVMWKLDEPNVVVVRLR